MNLTDEQIRYAEVELIETRKILEHAIRNLEFAVGRTPGGNLLAERLGLIHELATNLRQELVTCVEKAAILGKTQPEPGRL
jgi:hypothetical protein